MVVGVSQALKRTWLLIQTVWNPAALAASMREGASARDMSLYWFFAVSA